MVKKNINYVPVAGLNGEIYLDFTNSQPIEKPGVIKQSIKGIGILGRKAVQAYQYRQSPEFAKKQIEELKLRNQIMQQQATIARNQAAIRQAKMNGRMQGNGLPPALSGNFNMIRGPFGQKPYQNKKKR